MFTSTRNTMAKKSRRQTAQPKRDNPGCMSGLISIFDFRQGRHTQRLLTDKKFGSKHGEGTVYSNNKFDVQGDLEDSHEDATDTDPKEIGRFTSSKTSLKALIEEEKYGAHISKKISTKVENARAQMVSETNLEKNHKKESKKYKVGSDHDANDSLASQSICPNPSGSNPFGINLAESPEVFCSENNKCHESNVDNVGDRKNNFHSEPDLQCALDHSILQKAQSDFTKALLDQKPFDTKQSIGDGGSQSTKFMDTLQMLNSNKLLSLKLLQDTDPLSMKHVLELQNVQIGECLHGSRHEEQDKSEEEMPSLALNRIVLLTPSPARYQQNSNTSSPIPSPILHHNSQHRGNERGSSNFSLKKIKRRIRNMIGESKKEHHLITMDGILHKVPYGYQNSDNNARSYCGHEHTSQISKILERGEKKSQREEHQSQLKWKDTPVANPLYRKPVFYEKAKKHLAEMVSAGGENGIRPTTRASITLGRLLSLPECNLSSPWLSPEREEGNDLPKEMRFFPVKLKHANSIGHSASTTSNPVDDNQALHSKPASLTTKLQTGEVMIQKGSNEIDESDNLEVPTECNCRPVFFGGVCNIEGSGMISELGAHKETQTPSVSVSPNLITVHKLEALENTMETPDRPSPVSVLEPLFLESISSPERRRIESGLRGSHQLRLNKNDTLLLDQNFIASEADSRKCIDDKKAKLEYVRTVLEASGLSCKQFIENWQSSNQLLDSFGFDEVEISCGRQMDDSRLLFDCVNEVLLEIHERYVSCTPWATFIRPNISPITVDGNFVQEVCKRFDRHFCLQFPCTMDQVVRKDLDCRTWMDLQFETERTIAETGEVILDYITEEIILELWD